MACSPKVAYMNTCSTALKANDMWTNTIGMEQDPQAGSNSVIEASIYAPQRGGGQRAARQQTAQQMAQTGAVPWGRGRGRCWWCAASSMGSSDGGADIAANVTGKGATRQQWEVLAEWVLSKCMYTRCRSRR